MFSSSVFLECLISSSAVSIASLEEEVTVMVLVSGSSIMTVTIGVRICLVRVFVGGILGADVVRSRHTILALALLLRIVRVVVAVAILCREGTMYGVLVVMNGLNIMKVIKVVIEFAVSVVRLAVERINIIVEVILVDNINHVLVRGHFECYMTTVCVVMMLLFTMAGRVHGVFVIAHGLNIAVIIVVVIDYTMSWLVSRVLALVRESM